MPVDIEISTHLNIRISAKVRYLAEIAARVKGVNLTDYVEATLMESFKNVYPLGEPHDIGMSLKERRDCLAAPVDSLSHYADALWDENPGVRLALRAASGAETLMREDERIVFNYILRQPAYAKNGKLNQRAIADHWHEIKTAALSEDLTRKKE
jgi:hypothetical protein